MSRSWFRSVAVMVVCLGAAGSAGWAGGGHEAVVLLESFEGGAVPPAGWTVTDTNPTFNWQAVTAPSVVQDGSFAAFVNFDGTLVQDEWLRSPVIDLPDTPDLTLSFWALSDTQFCPFEGASVSVVVTDAADTPLEAVWDMCSDETWPDFRYRLVTVDLGAYHGQSVKLAWRYAGVNGQSFGLDLVVVDAVPLPEIFADDFESGDVSDWSDSVG